MSGGALEVVGTSGDRRGWQLPVTQGTCHSHLFSATVIKPWPRPAGREGSTWLTAYVPSEGCHQAKKIQDPWEANLLIQMLTGFI